MAITGTTYDSKQQLLDTGIGDRVFKNEENLVDAKAVQHAMADIVENLWVKSADQDLQSVLETGSLATGIDTDLDITLNDGSRIKLGAATTKIESIQGSDANVYTKFNQSPQTIDIKSDTGTDVGSTMYLQAGSAKIGGKNSLDGPLYMHGTAGSGFCVSKTEANPGATALLDVNGTFRVRDVVVNDTDVEMLTVDADGNVHKRVISSSSGIQTTVFSASSTYISAVVTKRITGREVDLHCEITYLDNKIEGGEWMADSVSINDILTIGDTSFKWFTPIECVGIVSSLIPFVDDGSGSDVNRGEFGSVVLSDLSSYSSGIESSGDNTEMFLPGTELGVGRSFMFSDYDVEGGKESIDRVESPGSNGNYITSSPKDLSLGGLNITFKNASANIVSDGSTSPYITKQGVYVFTFKGSLM